jgi:hypothetical protein
LENGIETEEVEVEATTDWEAEAKKWKAIAERKAKKAEQTKTVTDTATLPSSEIERLTLKVDGYNDAEISEIMKLGGVKSLSNPLVKKAIDTMRQERLAENAQVTDSGANSDFARKYSEADLRKMSAEELEKILPKS